MRVNHSIFREENHIALIIPSIALSFSAYFHSGGPEICDICGRTCANSRSLKKHKKIHVEGSKEKFKCTICGNGFRDRTKLKEHTYIHTGKMDAYFCQFCRRPFRFGSSLSAHRKICKERHEVTE